MSLKLDCLGHLPMTAEDVEGMYYRLRVMNNTFLSVEWAAKLCLSHERLRAENEGLQIMLKEAEEKNVV